MTDLMTDPMTDQITNTMTDIMTDLLPMTDSMTDILPMTDSMIDPMTVSMADQNCDVRAVFLYNYFGMEKREEMGIHLTQASCKRTDNTNKNKPKYENIDQA